MKSIALLFLVPVMAFAQPINLTFEPVPKEYYQPVPVAPPQVNGAYYGNVGSGSNVPQTEPTQHIRTYAGPRYYHDHGPPPFGGTGRYAPERSGVQYQRR